MAELEGLKKVLRSLVVSSAATMDAASLLRDYRRMLGEPLPSAKHGFRDPVQFLRERCSDCFLFQGSRTNPILTLIVPDSIKHIDQYVQSQKTPKLLRGKRRSVPESMIKKPQPNLIASTFNPESNSMPNGRATYTPNSRPTEQMKRPEPVNTCTEPAQTYTEPRKSEQVAPTYTESRKPEPAPQLVTKPVAMTPKPVSKKPDLERSEAPSAKVETLSNGHSEENEEGYSQQRLQRFLQKRMPVYQSQRLAGSRESLRDDDSGRQTSSSLSERSATALATLHAQIRRLVARRPEGVWCSELLRLYEEEFGYEMNFGRFRYPSVSACACAVDGLTARRASTGDWLLTVRTEQEAPRCEPALRLRRVPRAASLSSGKQASRSLLDADDALPGIDYDPDVYPPDCLSFLESIPAGSLAGVAPGDMIPLVVGEVYSPSHLWLQRLGPEHELMQQYMDEMTEYFTKGEGVDRVLAAGARRPGQYCSSVFEGDWHRSLIVQVVDSDTVKVRHVDYGTVDTVAASSLRPLKREWGSLPAQAVRARLAGLRPAASSRRWPRAAAAHCLHLVRERRLVGNVVAVDREESILEVFLIDTSTDEDVNISEQLIRAGHADPRPLPALGARDGYLLPTFHALETGVTPNYSEIYALLRDGIALEFVDAYRDHVAGWLPSSDDSEPPERERAEADGALALGPDPVDADGELASAERTSELGSSAPSSPPPPPPPLAGNRVPMAMSLLRIASPDPTEDSPLLRLSPEPSPVPASTPGGSPTEGSAESDSPVPELPERRLAPNTSAPAPAPVPTAPARPACCCGPPRAPHPASFYALPCCPCSQPYKPPGSVSVPVSLPMVHHYAAGYFRPRVSPQPFFPQYPRPPVGVNFYGSNLAGQPIYRHPPQNFPQNFVPNSAHSPQRFVPNSLQNRQFVPNGAQIPQYFGPNPNPGPHPQNFKPMQSNVGQFPQNVGPGPAPNPQHFKPVPAQGQQNSGPGPAPDPQTVAPSPASQPPNSGPSPQRPGPAPPGAAPDRTNLPSGPISASCSSLTGGDGPSVRLSAEECEIFELLSRVDPGAAHRYMIAALRRARAAAAQPGLAGPQAASPAPPAPAGLNPDAVEFRAPQTAAVRPPPGFENFIK